MTSILKERKNCLYVCLSLPQLWVPPATLLSSGSWEVQFQDIVIERNYYNEKCVCHSRKCVCCSGHYIIIVLHSKHYWWSTL